MAEQGMEMPRESPSVFWQLQSPIGTCVGGQEGITAADCVFVGFPVVVFTAEGWGSVLDFAGVVAVSPGEVGIVDSVGKTGLPDVGVVGIVDSVGKTGSPDVGVVGIEGMAVGSSVGVGTSEKVGVVLELNEVAAVEDVGVAEVSDDDDEDDVDDVEKSSDGSTDTSKDADVNIYASELKSSG